MTNPELQALREEAVATMHAHDPAQQAHGYERCEICHFTWHPCDAYWLAESLVQMIDDMS